MVSAILAADGTVKTIDAAVVTELRSNLHGS